MNATTMRAPRDLPLARFTKVDSPDLDRARSVVASAFCPHTLRPTVIPDGTSNIRFHSVEVGDVGMHYLDYGSEVEIRPADLDDFYLIQIPLAGTAQISVGDEEFQSDTEVASLLQPGLPVRMRWHTGNRQLLIRVARHRLEAQLQDLLGTVVREPIRFGARVDLRSSGIRSLGRIVGLLRDEMDDRATAPHPFVVRELERALLGQLLVAQPGNYRDALQRPAESAAPRVIRRAAELLETHAAELLTIDDIAAAAGISVRALQDGFRKHYGTTPMAHLREIRLQHARRRLVDTDPSATTVSEIAAACGFVHLGRFSVQYRERFGESPSATLRS